MSAAERPAASRAAATASADVKLIISSRLPQFLDAADHLATAVVGTAATAAPAVATASATRPEEHRWVPKQRSSRSCSTMGAVESVKSARGCCKCVCLQQRHTLPAHARWGASPSTPAATYEIRSSHSRRSDGHCNNRRNLGCKDSCSCRPPKLGSTEPYLSCILLQQQLVLPQQLPLKLCAACAATAACRSSCIYCTSRVSAEPSAAGSSRSLAPDPCCSSHGSSSSPDAESEAAPCASSAAGTLGAPDAASLVNCKESPSSTPPEYPRRSSIMRKRFPCAACWVCSKGSSINIRVLQLLTARGSTIPALYIQHPAAQQTLLLSHSSNSDLGWTYPLLVFLCRSLSVNVMAYEYTGYGFCCCRSKKQQQQPQQQRRLCRASAAGVYADIRAAFMWLLQHQQQTPQSVILYSEGRGLLPALGLRSELSAEGLQLGGLVFVSPASSAAAAAAAAPTVEAAGKKKVKSRLSGFVPLCCFKRSDLHEVYMQLLQFQEDELLILEAKPTGNSCEGLTERTPQLVLRQRAAAAATIAATDEPCCICTDTPKGENLRRLREYVERAGQQQQRQELALQQHHELLQQKQQALRGLLDREQKGGLG
ncbi:hypothetical protein Efla_000159 [Eimeria flavescens]